MGNAGAPGTGREGPAPLRFRNAAGAAGIRFRHENGAAGDFNLPETMASGCAFLDYDRDGWPDILLLNGRRLHPRNEPVPAGPATLRLYHNNRNGTFSDATAGSGLEEALFGTGCAVGDYDNDGLDDLYVTTALDGSRLYHNQGNGRFEEVSERAGVRNAGRWGASAAWVDYDRDGRLDLFVCNYVQYHWGEDRRCFVPGTVRTYCNPRIYAPETSRLFRNTGKGRFQEVSAATGITAAAGKALGVVVLDYDDDGWPDLMVACDTTRNLLFHNRRGRFREEGIGMGTAYGENGSPRAGMGIDAAYLWNDDRLAVLVSNFAQEGLSLFTQNQKGGAFLDTAPAAGMGPSSRPFLGFGLAFLDADNDGLRDALIGNGHVDPTISRFSTISHAQRHLLYHNTGGGHFEEVGESAGEAFRQAWVSRGLAVADYDQDGRLDVLISNNGQEAELLHNESPRSGHWLAVELTGSISNRDGIGAAVNLTAGGVTQRDWVRSGGSYLSQSALTLHFGLGAAAVVDALEVRWPSGTVSRYSGIAADRKVRLQEGRPELLPP
jgi:hypothetical protein